MKYTHLIRKVLLALLLLGAAGCLFWLVRVAKVSFGRPWYLLLALVLPLLWLGYGKLSALGPARRALAMGLRSLAVLALVLALAELMLVRDEDAVTVLVVADRSFSIPQELDSGTLADQRWNRLNAALREASRKTGRPQDKLGVISFARQPRLEFPAGQVPELSMLNIGTGLDRNYTDLAAAIRMGLASFPEGGARRLLLISDGNENRGNALAEARTARLNNVPIDVLPVRYRYADEILVDRIDLPSETQPDQDVPMRIVLRNYSGRRVRGQLKITRSVDKASDTLGQQATLEPGLNVLQGKWPARLAKLGGVVVYKAVFLPEGLPADRADNNEAWAPVIVSSKGRRLLVVVQNKDSTDFQSFVQALKNSPFASASGGLRTIDVWEPSELPGEKDQRRYELSNYDTIVLFNIPADMVSREQQEALRKNVRDQGAGLVVVGGTDSFGAGRWQGEPLEEALPVNTALRSRKVQGKGGLVLIMHASEMAEGNFWQKEIAKLAINKLAPQDEVGILYYSYGNANAANAGHVWHVPLQEVGPNKAKIIRSLASMEPGDMPQFDPSMQMAQKSLTEPERGLSVRHVILISDGDHGLLQDLKLLDQYKKSRITLTTVGVTTHGPAAQEALAAISKPLGGRHYAVDDPAQLPAIYMKETRVISQNFLFEKPFRPQLTGEVSDPLREWTKVFPPLGGFVRTSRKESNLVQVLMRASVSGEEENPILAQWQYGLGRVVAFTSDAIARERGWAKEWIGSNLDLFNDFWARVVEWSLRTVDDAGLALQARYENGKIIVSLVDNRTKEQRAAKPLGSLRLTVASSASPEAKELALDPVSAGVYEASVEAEASGSYGITVSSGGQGGKPVILGRGAASVPYSPEFAVVEDNSGLLEQIAQITGGRMIEEKDLAGADLFKKEGPGERRMQPVWHWLLLAAAVLLFLDVAVRRIAIDPLEVAGYWRSAWARFRGQGRLEGESQSYFDRLRSRKEVAQASFEQAKADGVAQARFVPYADVKPVSAEPPPTSAAPPPRPPAEAPPASGDDFAARLMKAKKKARESIEGEE